VPRLRLEHLFGSQGNERINPRCAKGWTDARGSKRVVFSTFLLDERLESIDGMSS